MSDLKLDLDEDLVAVLRQFNQPIESAAREMIVLELYRRGSISSGKAAELLAMDRLAFIQYSGRLGIPYFNMTPAELDAELTGLGTL